MLEPKRIEYTLEGNLKNLSVCIFSVPFSLKGSSKCTNHVNVHRLYAVEYINTVYSLDYSFQFRIFNPIPAGVGGQFDPPPVVFSMVGTTH